jgi:hypothetical protein
VTGFWREPKLFCTAGRKSYVTVWVGLGGFAPGSIATEQIGTEGDCHADGRQVAYAWYKLQPGGHKAVSMLVRPGDVIEGIVTLGRGTVTLELADHSNPQLYAQTFADTRVDDSSADWVVSSRPFCISSTACQPLPLADFRYIRFGLSATRLSTGYTGTIADPHWTRTALSIGLHGRRYGLLHATSAITVGGATPSALSAGGVFRVDYRTLSVGSNPFL